MMFPHRLQWRVRFKDTLSEPNVTQSYIPSDSVGLIQRNREIFVFTLTSNNSSGLVSTMTVDVNLGTLINDATVSCSQGAESYQQAVLHVHDGIEMNRNIVLVDSINLPYTGPPTSPMNLSQQAIQGNSRDITLQWNSSNVVDYYIITVSPPVESGSTFTTPNTSIQLPVLYNQEYNVSVVANNCAGNSEPAEIIFRIGKSMAVIMISQND